MSTTPSEQRKAEQKASKDDLIQSVKQQGASDQVINTLQRLPDKTFTSSLDVQNALGGLGNLGNIKL